MHFESILGTINSLDCPILGMYLAAFQTIRSDKHSISSLEIRKVGLCAFDNKRHLLGDGITSYSYGHYKIAEN